MAQHVVVYVLKHKIQCVQVGVAQNCHCDNLLTPKIRPKWLFNRVIGQFLLMTCKDMDRID